MRTLRVLSLALLAGWGCIPDYPPYDGRPPARPPYGGQAAPITANVTPLSWRVDTAAQQAARHQATAEQAARTYAPRRASGSVDVGVHYPAVVDGNVITSHLHLMGGTLNGKRFNFVRLQLRNSGGGTANLRVSASLLNFSEPASTTVSIPPGATWEGGLTPAFTKEVGGITELTPSGIRVTVADDRGGIVYDGTEPVKLLSRNDVIMGNDRFLPFIATHVTPNDRAVDELLSYAAEFTPKRTIKGYLGSKREDVQAEVAAIYQAIAKLGVHYRNHPGSFMDSKAAHAQRVTFPAESIHGTGANCIDGAVLFASAFEAAKLDGFIVKVTSHAFVGVRLEQGKPDCLYVETTLVGRRPFSDAVRAATERFNKSGDDPLFRIVAIPWCRSYGVKPFPYPLGTGGLPWDRLKAAPPPTPAPSGEPRKPPGPRAQVGLVFRSVPKETALANGIDCGVLVEHVRRGGPAEKAGLKEDDILLEFNGQKLADAKTLLGLISASKAGVAVPIKLLREGKPLTSSVVPELAP